MTVLVLSGSLGTRRAMWDPVIPLLEERYDVLAYDHPGHGKSPLGPSTLEDLARVALEQLPPRCHFCGISLGGMIGIWLAANAPERIERLVLCCTAPRFASPENWQQRADLVRTQGMAPLVEMLLERWFTPEFPDRERFRRMLLEMSPEGYARCCEAIRDADLHSDLSRIEARTLIVTGKDDPAVSADDTRQLATIRDAGVAELRGRHLAPVERAQEFAELISA